MDEITLGKRLVDILRKEVDTPSGWVYAADSDHEWADDEYPYTDWGSQNKKLAEWLMEDEYVSVSLWLDSEDDEVPFGIQVEIESGLWHSDSAENFERAIGASSMCVWMANHALPNAKKTEMSVLPSMQGDAYWRQATNQELVDLKKWYKESEDKTSDLRAQEFIDHSYISVLCGGKDIHGNRIERAMVVVGEERHKVRMFGWSEKYGFKKVDIFADGGGAGVSVRGP